MCILLYSIDMYSIRRLDFAVSNGRFKGLVVLPKIAGYICIHLFVGVVVR